MRFLSYGVVGNGNLFHYHPILPIHQSLYIKLDIMKQEITKKILTLENKTNLLKHIFNIRRTLLSCGAYSDSNMESQNIRFEKLNVPEWEKQIIRNSWASTKKLSHELLYELKELNELILNKGE